MRPGVPEPRVGPYRILRKIRAGGQGQVFLGYDTRLERRVAIKIYTMPSSRAGRRALLNEARLVAALQSPRIVQVHDVITSSGHLAMVMEYVPGTDLEAFLEASRPSFASILSIAADLAAALAATRQRGIVHGDLKASNVLIASNGRAKLSDFGIARPRLERTQLLTHSHAGVSPEQFRGEALDPRSDLFALGCLLYRMISGRHPFFRGGRFAPELLADESPAPLDRTLPGGVELPEELAEVVMQLLAKDPRDRPVNTHSVREVLRRVSRQVPLSAGNPVRNEAALLFRPESADELPLAVPEELSLEGRSRLSGKPPRRRLSLRNPADRPWFVLAASGIGAVVLACVLLVDYLGWTEPVRVHIDRPDLAIDSGAAIPEDLSMEWLVDELKQALGRHLGPMLVTGPVGATPMTTVYTRGRSPADVPARERFTIGLRCDQNICLLGLSRERGQRRFTGSAMLFPDRQTPEWRLAVQRAVRELFRQPGTDLPDAG